MHKVNTVDLVKNVRDIYLNFNKNYTNYLNIDITKQDNIFLKEIFNTDVLNDYRDSVDALNNILTKNDSKDSKKKSVVFTEDFDFNLSDQQKKYSTELLIDSINSTIDNIKKDNENINILSLGIGDGSTAQKYSDKLDKKDIFIGCDIHDKYLLLAKENVSNLKTIKIDLNDIGYKNTLPLSGHSFDIIECCNVCHHIESFQSIVNEVYRLLKPGGFFYYLDLIDKTNDLSDEMIFEDNHVYPSFHGIEFFRSALEIKKCLKKLFVLKKYQRIGPGIAFYKVKKPNLEK
ncbi:MAG: class I SAM-dependent methyltransferase [Desulfobacterales bacterium]|nr:class I SAM-dependent methyltransferase [Desulfobacterales bacterium]MCP4158452.1 class I SAM-dependent methyltransferase [Deltaproteobacteria bacterium]